MSENVTVITDLPEVVQPNRFFTRKNVIIAAVAATAAAAAIAFAVVKMQSDSDETEDVEIDFTELETLIPASE